ncbi:30S ribosomal protein S17 [Patescibacteria group bacterium]|nr:30S ribosomal protein S17 [Patescibacteria group bacterium]MBU4274931.1 30S ribosomal protein S17 [Patescibacteria group bacterium]MBU4367887.1 30S ribosomal protein S17 [Patescibacteria group bacterium]MBU4461936.1 30S ribosomal protein S17 [Patescibacteria group bacterium]MCG2699879.1 30S ribosomal protein S17 [Candidatus Parcubacteria bacterium]
MSRKKLTGKVISDKMQKTVVVLVERIKQHPKYGRRYKVHKKYKAHDEKGEYKAGDEVIIEECKPISKGKKWKVVGKF